MQPSNGAPAEIETLTSTPIVRTLWWIGAVGLVIAGVIFVVVGMRGPDVGPSISGPIGVTSQSLVAPHSVRPAPSATVSSRTGTRAPSPTVNDRRSVVKASNTNVALASTSSRATTAPPTASRRDAAVVERSRPVLLSIPAIGLSERVSELGLNANGTVQAPTSWVVPGWYKLGPSPGEEGSAVILGHVDSVNGPAAFYRLSQLRPGDRVVVRLASGRLVRFEVIGLRMYSKAKFPDQLVYGPRSYDALQLVTCGGVFDATTHHYLSNLVVFTARIT
jgi:Sortase domain